MSWITVIWSMIAAACLTLAAMHSLVWFKSRREWDGLLYALAAVATAGLAFCELWMMQSSTTVGFGEALRWLHLPGWAVIVMLVTLVRLHLRAGRRWLAWTVCGLRTLSLLLNFFFTPNLNFLEITGLRHIPFLGESVSIAEGVRNPWMLVGQLSFFLLLIYVVDAMITVWRRKDRLQLRLLSAAIVFFFILSTIQVVLSLWGFVETPITASIFFMGVLIVMGAEMSAGVLSAAKLSADLRESDERMSLTTQAAGVGLWIWDFGTNQVWGSERWLELFGLGTQPNVAYERVVGRIHPDDQEQVEQEVRRAVADRADYMGEFRLIGEDGAELWIGAQARISPDMNGNPVRMMGAAIDITERKQAEQKVDQQNRELAHLSRITMLSELAGSLAHELNQPLAIILSNAQAAQRLMAQEPPDLAEVRDILADIVGEDERAGEVIRRMRAMLKHGEPRLLPLVLSEVIEEVLHLVNSDLIGRGVIVHRAFSPDLPQVLGDPIQLQQVLLNLILNACDAMDANPRTDRFISIATEYRNGMVCTSVSDNGCGLPAEVERVFVSFHTTKKDGLGLGLSICRSIVSAHHGRLWAEGNEARGATFYTELPAIKEVHS